MHWTAGLDSRHGRGGFALHAWISGLDCRLGLHEPRTAGWGSRIGLLTCLLGLQSCRAGLYCRLGLQEPWSAGLFNLRLGVHACTAGLHCWLALLACTADLHCRLACRLVMQAWTAEMHWRSWECCTTEQTCKGRDLDCRLAPESRTACSLSAMALRLGVETRTTCLEGRNNRLECLTTAPCISGLDDRFKLQACTRHGPDFHYRYWLCQTATLRTWTTGLDNRLGVETWTASLDWWLQQQRSWPAGLESRIVKQEPWTADSNLRLGLQACTQTWIADLDHRLKVHAWSEGTLDCRFGLQVWTAGLDCRFGLQAWTRLGPELDCWLGLLAWNAGALYCSLELQEFWIAGLYSRSLGLQDITSGLDCILGLHELWTASWNAGLDCKTELHAWTAVNDCNLGLQVAGTACLDFILGQQAWTAEALDCRFGPKFWTEGLDCRSLELHFGRQVLWTAVL